MRSSPEQEEKGAATARLTSQPSGITGAGLYVADSEANIIRAIDTRKRTVETLAGGDLFDFGDEDGARAAAPNAQELKVASQRLSINASNAVVLDVRLPAGYHLNEAAPQRYSVSVESGKELVQLTADSPAALSRTLKELQLPLRIPLRALGAGRAELRIQLTLYYCREDNTGTCQIKTLLWRAPLEITREMSAPREIKLQAQVE